MRRLLLGVLAVTGIVLVALLSTEISEYQRSACSTELHAVEHANDTPGRAEVRVARAQALQRLLDGCLSRAAIAEDRRRALDEVVRRGEEEAARKRSERLAADEARGAAEWAKKDDERRIGALAVKMRSDRHVQQIVQTLAICGGDEARRQALAAIAKERRYSKQAGVVNLSLLEALKEDLRQADDQIAAARTALKSVGGKPTSCRHPDVALLSTCVDRDDSVAACESDDMRARVYLFNHD